MTSRPDPQMEDVRARELRHFNELWGASVQEPGPDTLRTFRSAITPAHLPGGSSGGLLRLRLYELLTGAEVAGKDVLDYGCGVGGWSIHLAQLGARVAGFDLSDVAIAHARARAAVNEVEVRFDVADAGKLPYEDASFDVVVGIGVIHHVIKYAGVASELRRVMRPGAIGLFSENLGQNPLIELARTVTMRSEKDAGDVVLTEARVREWAKEFASCSIEGHSLTYMLKRVTSSRTLLHALYRLDEALLQRFPALRRYCGESIVMLRP